MRIVARLARLPRGAASSAACRNSSSAASKLPSCARMRARRDNRLSVSCAAGASSRMIFQPRSISSSARRGLPEFIQIVAQSSCRLAAARLLRRPGRLEQAQRLAVSLMRGAELSHDAVGAADRRKDVRAFEYRFDAGQVVSSLRLQRELRARPARRRSTPPPKIDRAGSARRWRRPHRRARSERRGSRPRPREPSSSHNLARRQRSVAPSERLHPPAMY